MVRLSVKDTGPGISAKDVPHLFERFWRAASALERGTGLGLSIAKSIVEAHGGTIWVETHEGAGSTFFFTLPAATS
jgi:signal transduction histidine kinase